MPLEDKIVTITEPSIEKDVIKFPNTNSTQINKFIPDQFSLDRFELNVSGFLPTLFISFRDQAGHFQSLYYPKDGDVVSVYLKPNHKKSLKPLRIDFDILECKSLSASRYTIFGIMKVPKIYTAAQRAFSEQSSFDTFEDVADLLELGFASNETETKDKQNWLNPGQTWKTFLNQLTKHAYKNDDSFYTSYVDPYYYLTFVNLNPLFADLESETGVLTSELAAEIESRYEQDEAPSKEEPLFLTNHLSYRGTTAYIEDWGLLNSTGQIWQNEGYFKKVQFKDFNDTEDEVSEFQLEPLTTENAEDNKILMRGRAGENTHKEVFHNEHMGTQLSDLEGETSNVHSEYLFARKLNEQNRMEVEKMAMNVTLSKANFNLHRYKPIPIVIFETEKVKKEYLKRRDEATSETEKNDPIEGPIEWYVIKEISYSYSKRQGNIKQDLKLIRREWPIQFEKGKNFDKN